MILTIGCRSGGQNTPLLKFNVINTHKTYSMLWSGRESLTNASVFVLTNMYQQHSNLTAAHSLQHRYVFYLFLERKHRLINTGDNILSWQCKCPSQNLNKKTECDIWIWNTAISQDKIIYLWLYLCYWLWINHRSVFFVHSIPSFVVEHKKVTHINRSRVREHTVAEICLFGFDYQQFL